MTRVYVACSAALLLSVSLHAQEGSAEHPLTIAAQKPHFPGRGLPGKRAGEERWIVHFKSRSFDLSALQESLAGNAGAAPAGALVADYERRMRADQAPFVAALRDLGGTVVAQWWLVNACAIEIDPRLLPRVEALANVAFVQPDVATEITGAAPILTGTNAANHDADSLQAAGHTGNGVACGIIDTGQDSNMNGTGVPHITYSRQGTTTTRLVVNRQIGLQPADDVHGHGTGVASIAAGWRWNTATADHGHAYDALIAGYAISDNTGGGSSLTTMANAYQQMVIDRPTFNIRASNLSYTGSPNPLSVEQQAADNAALVADILVCTAAGNAGTFLGSSQINCNGLSVGACEENTHVIAGFSCRGLINGNMAFPAICANGVSTNMALRNNEAGDYIASGTSMASPMVCGAATQLRARFPTLNAAEVKAVLLASTQASPGTGATQVSTGPGVGYLHNPSAHGIATSSLRRGRGTFTASAQTYVLTMPVTAGITYQVALAWHRMDTTLATWSNLDLRVRNGGTTIIESLSAISTLEFVRFTAPSTGNYTVEIVATALTGTNQPFAWATTADAAPSLAGLFTAYGSGCAGSGSDNFGTSTIVPAAYAATLGEGNNYFPLGRANIRYQQVFLGSEIGLRPLTGVSFRDDNGAGGPAGTVPLTVTVGTTTRTPTTLDTTSTFASNFNLGSTVVFNGNWSFPASAPPTPTTFSSTLAFNAPVIFAGSGTRNFLIQIDNNAATDVFRFFDACSSASATTTRVWATPIAATPTGRNQNYGLVMALRGPLAGATPLLSGTGVPTIGASFQINLSNARPSAPAILWMGYSQTSAPVPQAPGCTLLASLDVFPLVSATTSASGTANTSMFFSNSPGLIGFQFYQQWTILDPVNPLSLVFSNGGAGRVGG